MLLEDCLRRAKEQPTTEHLQAVWKTALELPVWYFIPAQHEGESSYPLVAEIGEARWLLGATSVRRHTDLCRGLDLVPADTAELPMLTLSVTEAIWRIRESAHAIDGLALNLHSADHFRISVSGLLHIVDQLEVA